MAGKATETAIKSMKDRARLAARGKPYRDEADPGGGMQMAATASAGAPRPRCCGRATPSLWSGRRREGWPSGLRRTPGKRVGGNSSRVQIPLPPPLAWLRYCISCIFHGIKRQAPQYNPRQARSSCRQLDPPHDPRGVRRGHRPSGLKQLLRCFENCALPFGLTALSEGGSITLVGCWPGGWRGEAQAIVRESDQLARYRFGRHVRAVMAAQRQPHACWRHRHDRGHHQVGAVLSARAGMGPYQLGATRASDPQ
jgi:hypothetical protein